MREYVTVRLPQDAWDKLKETLELDSESSAFDPELRKEIREALDQVEHVADSPSLVQAAKDVLEWAAQMGGWEAPCWERLRVAVREAATQGESPDSAEAALRHIFLHLPMPGNRPGTYRMLPGRGGGRK